MLFHTDEGGAAPFSAIEVEEPDNHMDVGWI